MQTDERRERERADAWERLRQRGGSEIGDAMRYLYAVYDGAMPRWLASLYDPDVGGFYYSRSSQATDGFLPDAESTYGALTFPSSTGMCGDTPWERIVPDWLRGRVGDFFLQLQAPDGYFYHPQWGKDISHLRKSRDLGTCQTVLRKLGYTPRYTVPTAPTAKGSYDLSHAPERFRSEEAYRAYLDSLDIRHKAYHAGSEMLSQLPEIQAYSAMLRVDLTALTMQWLDGHQNAENGLWHDEVNYYGTNGLHKISWVYNGTSRPLPHPERALESAIAVILSDEAPTASVDVYNPWHAAGEVIKNIARFGSAEQSRALRARLLSVAPQAIRHSADKIRIFKKPDGGMSYLPSTSCSTTQGAPAAVHGTCEGDVNGALCASTSLVRSIFGALDLSDVFVPMYTRGDLDDYLHILAEREGMR